MPALISSIRNRLEEEGHHRLVDLRSEEICAWRLTLPEGHRFEATGRVGVDRLQSGEARGR